MQIYHLKSCDTCRKAIKALADRGPELIEIHTTPVTRDQYAAWLANLDPETLINRKSTTWRGLSTDARAGDPLDLLQAHPTLMKRPIIAAGGVVYAGWTPAVRAALGLE